MIRQLRNTIFLLAASGAIFLACSKKDDGIVTFKVDKTTSTTGAYNGDQLIGTGSTTGTTAASTTAASTTSGNTPSCTPAINTVTLSTGNRMSFSSAYFSTGDYELSAYGSAGEITMYFNQQPTADHVYTTLIDVWSYDVNIHITMQDGTVWRPDDNQSLYVKVDKTTGKISATMCGMKFSSYNYSSTSSTATVDGNLSNQ